jgi:plastocyanin
VKPLHIAIIGGIALAFMGLFSLFMIQTGNQFNIYINGIHTDTGYSYSEESTHTTNILDSGIKNSSIHVLKGTMVALHFINKDNENDTKLDLNIDEFNIHINQLSYSESQTVTFIADKQGTFTYYSNLHPKMRGSITVDPPNTN